MKNNKFVKKRRLKDMCGAAKGVCSYSEEWPIQLGCLTGHVVDTNPLSQSNDDNSKQTINETNGIVDKKFLKGWVLALYEKIKLPIVIIHKINGTCEPDRIEAEDLYIKFAPLCGNYRSDRTNPDGAGKQKADCFDRDSNVADYVRDYENGKNPEIPKCIQLQENDKEIRKTTEEDEIYYEYVCPCVNLTEWAIPIMIEGEVVAVLITGQMAITKKQSESALHKFRNESWYEKLGEFERADGEEKLCVMLPEEIIKKRNELFEEVNKLRKDITDKLNEKRRSKINEIQDHVLRKFLFTEDQFKNRINRFVNEKDMENLWNNFKSSLLELQEKMGYQSITVFALRSVYESVVNEHITGYLIDKQNASDSKLYFDIKSPEYIRMLESRNTKWVDLLLEPDEIAKVIKDVDLAPLSRLYIFTLKNTPTSSIAFMISYKNIKAYEKTIGTLEKDLFQNIGNHYIMQWLVLQEKYSSDRLEEHIRISYHELAQVTTGMDISINKADTARLKFLMESRELRNELKRKIPDATDFLDRVEVFVKDIYRNNEQLRHLSNLQAFSADLPEPNKDRFLPYDVVIFKWIDAMKSLAKNNQMVLESPEVHRKDKERPKMYADARQIEEIVYNLLSNAIKYGYPGTKIHFDCKLSFDKTKYLLSVTDYGNIIDAADDKVIYQKYGRGRAGKMSSNGIGLGLFISQKIAIAHGGDLTHRSEPISGFNVPFMNPYLQLDKSLQDEVTCERIMEQRDMLLQKKLYNEIIGLPLEDNNLIAGRILKSIKKPTARNVFLLSIPVVHDERSRTR